MADDDHPGAKQRDWFDVVGVVIFAPVSLFIVVLGGYLFAVAPAHWPWGVGLVLLGGTATLGAINSLRRVIAERKRVAIGAIACLAMIVATIVDPDGMTVWDRIGMIALFLIRGGIYAFVLWAGGD